MPLNLPENRKVIDSRTKADIQAELQDQNPYLRASFLAALASATAGRNFEFYIQLQNALDESFAQTATGTSLAMWGALRSVTKTPASKSQGLITITGINGTVVPVNALLSSNSGIQIETQAEVTILAQTLGVFSLIRTGFTVTVVTSSEHSFATGMSVTISGADPVEYNGLFSIIVTGVSSFTYEIAAQPASPAAGTKLVSATYGSVLAKSTAFGINTNLDAGTQVSFVSTPAGADTIALTQFDGLTGGTEAQTDADFRTNVLAAWQNPNTPFNVAELTRVSRLVSGVTRVFVGETFPGLGQVTIYFVRDNDANIFPSPQEIQEVRDQILLIKPAHVAPANVIVRGPRPLVVNFQFLGITPNTASMRNSIAASLFAFFQDSVSLGEDIAEDAYTCAIYGTIDSANGQRLRAFNLGSPAGDIPVAIDELPVLGQVIFS